MQFTRARRFAAAFACAASVVALCAHVATAAPPVVAPSATSLAQEIVANPAIVTGADYVTAAGGGRGVAIATDPIGSFPTGGTGTGFGILTTGDPNLAYAPNDSGSSSGNLGGGHVRGNTDYDVTVLRIDLDIPATANCLVGMDFRFLSEEYPEYVGTGFNDAFIAELDKTTWTTNGSAINAPDNFAFDSSGSPITINAAGVSSMTAENAAGTTYDGATPLLTAATPVTPGKHSLYLSIFDQGDHIYDSAVFVDNLRFGWVGNIAQDCKAGVDLAKKKQIVGLGDSYSSGYGMEPFYSGTHKDGTANDCQRSQLAFAPNLSKLLGLALDFHACQGAVTRDFYSARAGGSWGEKPQLDYLDENTGLVTYSIGGNDAHFADVLAECILGFELLPFNTCYNDDKVTKPVAEAFARLDGLTATPAEIVPYDTLMKDIRGRSPYAARVQVGYPPFFTSSGSDRTWLPGGRCEGVKKADQRWMVEKVAELNAIIARNAARNGFLFADPTGAFKGHELCSGGDEWFYGLLSSGRYHPNQAGHAAMTQAIMDQLNASGALPKLLVGPKQTVIYKFDAGAGLVLLSVILEWPGSDIQLTLVSPSGKTYTRQIPGDGVYHSNGATWEQFQIPNPEPGEWTAKLYGADVKAGGEEATIQVYREQPPNQRPTAAIDLRREGAQLVLDGSRSSDADGHVASWDWYVSTGATDDVYQGQTVSIPATVDPQSITLVVTDDRGLTDFATVATLPIDVKPGSDDNPINVGAKGKTPVAVLSTAAMDATTVDAASLKLGPKGAPPAENGVHNEDVNGDGRLDLMLQFETQDLGVTAGMTTLCLSGNLPSERGRTFLGCDSIRTT